MNENYEKLFSQLEKLNPPIGLSEKIMASIREKRTSALKYRLGILSFSLLASIAVFVPALQIFRAGLAESGFMDFLSLLSSDTRLVLNYWQSFSFSLLEALPALSLTIVLAAVLTFFESLKSLIKNAKPLFRHQIIIS